MSPTAAAAGSGSCRSTPPPLSDRQIKEPSEQSGDNLFYSGGS